MDMIRSQIKKALIKSNDINLSNDQQLELEIRLGKFKNGRFFPGIPEISFNHLLKSYEWTTELIDETIFKDIPEKQRKNQGWVLKDSIQKTDDIKNNLRLAFNLETLYSFNNILERHNATNETFTKDNIELFRKKTRYSKIVDHWKIDLTKVDTFIINNNEWKKEKTVFEVEIELYDWNIDALNTFDNVWNMLSKYHYGSMIYPHYFSLTQSRKFIGNQPKTLEKENMHMLSKKYMVTDKADGKRMFLFYSKIGCFLIDNQLHAFPYHSTGPHGTLLDGEYVDGKFLAFDCLFYKGVDIRKQYLPERLECLKVLNIESKIFLDIKESNDLWNNRFNFSYDLDGLIFTPLEQGYNGNILKWKNEPTMDVYINDNYELFCWSGKDKSNVLISSFFKPTNVVQSLDIIQKDKNAIIEIGYNHTDNVWIQKCIRNDKTKPNALLTIQGVIKAITEKITIDDILQFLESDYQTIGSTHQERQIKMDVEYRKFHNNIKNYLISFPKERKTLLDFGCGKGGDIMKWIKAGYTDVLAIDSSHTHLYGPNGFRDRYEKVKDKINITFVWGNILKPLAECGMNELEKDKLKPWLNKNFDVISCQFAIHYFMDSKNDWVMMMKNIQNYLKPNGYFIGTYLNAHNLTKLDNEHVFKINDKPFYTLKHNNDVNTYKELKQSELLKKYLSFWKLPRHKISVQTTEWDNEIEENVLFPEYLDILLVKGKLKKIENNSFENLLDLYHPVLSNDELLLSSLHNYFIYQY